MSTSHKVCKGCWKGDWLGRNTPRHPQTAKTAILALFSPNLAGNWQIRKFHKGLQPAPGGSSAVAGGEQFPPSPYNTVGGYGVCLLHHKAVVDLQTHKLAIFPISGRPKKNSSGIKKELVITLNGGYQGYRHRAPVPRHAPLTP